ncbi:MAG: glycosyl hydrolase [Acidobacteria bacterium]|nr:MAG: glycosyl hydrolase [Acidobacteriota bacterium]
MCKLQTVIYCDNLFMRFLPIIIVTTAALAQSPQILATHTAESLRGASAVSRKIAWVSGTHGTYLRTTDGQTWVSAQVPGAESLDFRAVVAFSDDAFLMSAGPGGQSRIYRTSDAGEHWQLQLTSTNPKGFFDSMVFWDKTHGIVLGDPIPDESGRLKFELLLTDDGQTWHQLPPANLPPALEGEGAFAASNTCIAILPGVSVAAATPDPNIWFATGGKVARVFHSPDRGQTWQVINTPILHGPDSAGIFSIAFRDATHGVIAGGDYKHPDKDGPNLAFTEDGGKTWSLSQIHPQAYFSAVAYERKPANKADSKERIFLVGQNFIFDFRPPANPIRLNPKKKLAVKFNAVSPYPEGGALIVGPKGTIATIP